MSNKPNLFHFATSELSQDAFLCWLLSWADSKCAKKDKALHETAVEFVRSIMEKCDKLVSKQSFNIEKVYTQYQSMDVLALIDEKYAMLIEDKTDTNMHGKQLSRYRKIVETDFPDRTHLLVYLKTGEISRGMEKKTAKQAGYYVYSRKDFLDVLRKGKDKIGNAIFCDFCEYLESKNAPFEAFQTKKVDEWVKEWDAWKGFFNELQAKLSPEELDWCYASNQRGGELVCYWGFTEYEDSNVYLEIHKKSDGRYFLAFKVSDVPKNKRAQVRWDLCNRLKESATKYGWDSDNKNNNVVDKPEKFGSGDSMIFCETKKQDYWLAKNADGMLAMETTINNLRKAKGILHDAVQ